MKQSRPIISRQHRRFADENRVPIPTMPYTTYNDKAKR